MSIGPLDRHLRLSLAKDRLEVFILVDGRRHRVVLNYEVGLGAHLEQALHFLIQALVIFEDRGRASVALNIVQKCPVALFFFDTLLASR